MINPSNEHLEILSPSKKLKTEQDEINELLQKFANYNMFLSKFRCNICDKEIDKSICIVCHDCQDFNLCFECLSTGKEKGNHQNSHSYIILDKLNYNLFCEEWEAIEEIMLIYGVEKFGLDNWKDISDFIASKSSENCEEHYFTFYYKDKNNSIPTNEDIISQRLEGMINIIPDKFVRSKEKLDDFKINNTLPKHIEQNLKLNEVPKSKNDTNEFVAETIGYMPQRGDFNIEYDNDAELILGDMEFIDNENPSDEALKLQVLDVYNIKLDERIRRKKFIIERNILDFKQMQKKEKEMSKEERELYYKLKPFMRFLDDKEFEEMFQTCKKMIELKKRQSELLKYKAMGLTTLKDVENYLHSVGTESSKKDEDNHKLIEMMTQNDKTFCQEFSISFDKFVKIKEIVSKNCNENSVIKKEELISLCSHIEKPEQVEKIYNFISNQMQNS